MADPKYKKLTNKIFEKIKNGTYADRLPGFNHLQAEFGVSQATLVSALDALEKQGLIVRKRRQGIFVSKSPRKRQKNPRIDLILPNYGGALFSQTIDFAHKFLEPLNYRLVVSITAEDPEHEQELLTRSTLDDSIGTIFMPQYETPKSVQALEKLLNTKPVVQIDRRYWAQNTDFVAVDSYGGSKLATQYLLKQHIKQIGFISSDVTRYADRKRFDGYQDALTEAGIKPPSSWQVAFPDNLSDSNISVLIKDSLNSPDAPRAFVAINSTMALIFLDAVKRSGFAVPEDIKIISFDITAVGENALPALTHYSQPTHLVMQEAVKLLDSRIHGDMSGHKEILIDPVFVKGQTA